MKLRREWIVVQLVEIMNKAESMSFRNEGQYKHKRNDFQVFLFIFTQLFRPKQMSDWLHTISQPSTLHHIICSFILVNALIFFVCPYCIFLILYLKKIKFILHFHSGFITKLIFHEYLCCNVRSRSLLASSPKRPFYVQMEVIVC